MLRTFALVGMVVAGLVAPERAATEVRAVEAPLPLVWSEAPAGATCDGELAFRLSIAAIATAP